MSATGHQVLSFVTSGEMTRRSRAITRPSLALEETAEAKDIGCVVELVMPDVAANGLGSLIALPATTKSPNSSPIPLRTRSNLTLSSLFV